MVNFDNCEIPIDNLVGNEGDGFKIAMKGLDGGRVNIAACSLGGARAALEASISYSAERKQFGKSIDQFQVTQFKLADMATELEAARLMVLRAARSWILMIVKLLNFALWPKDMQLIFVLKYVIWHSKFMVVMGI